MFWKVAYKFVICRVLLNALRFYMQTERPCCINAERVLASIWHYSSLSALCPWRHKLALLYNSFNEWVEGLEMRHPCFMGFEIKIVLFLLRIKIAIFLTKNRNSRIFTKNQNIAVFLQIIKISVILQRSFPSSGLSVSYIIPGSAWACLEKQLFGRKSLYNFPRGPHGPRGAWWDHPRISITTI